MRRGTFIAASLILCSYFSSAPAHGAAAGVSGTLSIVPGLGQVVNGSGWEGLGWFSSVLALTLSGNSELSQIGFDLWMYNMYDAYRDAGPQDRRIDQHNLLQNYVAAYNPLNLLDPIGLPIVAFGAYSGASSGYPALRSPVRIIRYGFVGLGEEALFRGFLFPGFSSIVSSKIAGAILSSAAFSVFHVTGGTVELEPSRLIQRFVGGLLFSWQADRNKYDLRKNIFAHAWYDIFVDDGGQIDGFGIQVPIRF